MDISSITFKNPLPKGILKDYEAADGNFITVNALPPEGLINEKVDAYLRRLKVRDLYDIFFLIKYSDSKAILGGLKKLIRGFKMPVDEKNLKVLIIDGIAPDANKMLDYIRGHCK